MKAEGNPGTTNLLTNGTMHFFPSFILLPSAFILSVSLPLRGAEPQSTLVWISMDGVRSDYLDRGPLPFLKRLQTEGASSRHFLPSFPPITFPSHCSEATGVPVDKHGITGNGFFDSSNGQSYRFPGDSTLLQAEPIWLTAKRQGVRVLVYDWPLSQAEHLPLHADYSSEKFDNAPSDAERLDHLLDTWRKDYDVPPEGHPPLRLLMGYVEAADPTGHQQGPDSPMIADAMQALDANLASFHERALALWKEHAGPGDRLYFLLSTDHGMSKVEHLAHLEKMLGVLPNEPDVNVQTVGNLGNVFVSGPERDKRIAGYLEKLKAWPFIRVFRREDLPAKWSYAHPTRVGDIVAILPKGYTYSRASPEPISDGNNPKGMHGYPVEENPEMEGVTLLWRYPEPFGGKDLGIVRWDQYHPTAAGLLGIQPAAGAAGLPIALPGETAAR